MKKLVCAVGLAVFLSGCGGGAYNHHTASQTQFQRDWEECEYEARRSTNIPYGGSTAMVIGAAIQINDLRNRCMALKGYSR
jgi:hypothetical protein